MRKMHKNGRSFSSSIKRVQTLTRAGGWIKLRNGDGVRHNRRGSYTGPLLMTPTLRVLLWVGWLVEHVSPARRNAFLVGLFLRHPRERLS
jgi:hypothetical protein